MEFLLLFSLVFVNTVLAGKDLPLAGVCDPEACRLPDCRCSSTDIPRELSAKETPQFVLLTFDDAVNVMNIKTYREVLYNHRNSHGCPIGATFYVSHEYTNYQLVNELYNRQFEIALHSITHQTPNSYWAHATYNDLMQEFGDQITLMSHFANIPRDKIYGIRSPFLQVSGNTSFQVIKDSGLIYDCSMPTNTFRSPGLWPYTLHYLSTQNCVVEPCPTASIPGPWVLPMISWTDLLGVPCSMVDSCFNVPDHTDENAWLEFILENFNTHYNGNRAPFGFYIHAWYLDIHPAVKRALIKFLDIITSSEDIFVVNSYEVIEWVKKPIPVNKYRHKIGGGFNHSSCSAASCGPLLRDEMSYWMQICNVCPNVYPWLGNPRGQ